jgi:hypothetical protein
VAARADLDSVGAPGSGDIYVVSDTDELAIWEGSTWVYVDRLQGEQGPAGEKGAAGDKGDTGAPGLQGLAGPAGAQGAQGTIGIQGPAGVQGPAGPQGPQGNEGSQGPQGEQGPGLQIIGEVSSRDDLGSIQSPTNGDIYVVSSTDELAVWDGAEWIYIDRLQGEAGPAGAQGDQGPVGPQGVDGSPGPQGAIGLTGPAGPQGPAGSIGQDGPPGPEGAPGPMGPAGVVDRSGVVLIRAGYTSNSRDVTATCPAPLKIVSANCSHETKYPGESGAVTWTRKISDDLSSYQCASSSSRTEWVRVDIVCI